MRDTLSPQCQVLSAAIAGKSALLERPGLRDWIYAPDVAAAVYLIATTPHLRHRLYNISTGRKFSVLDWGQALARHFPGFLCRLAQNGEKPTIDLHAVIDRAPLSVVRLANELGWRAPTGGLASADLLASWWQQHRQEIA